MKAFYIVQAIVTLVHLVPQISSAGARLHVHEHTDTGMTHEEEQYHIDVLLLEQLSKMTRFYDKSVCAS